MLINVLKSKIHRTKVTNTNLEYEGSCAIDHRLLVKANIRPYEQIHIYNVNNGERFSTYAIPGNLGEIDLRGSAARKAVVGDIVIICAYGLISEEQDWHQPIEIYVDDKNEMCQTTKDSDWYNNETL
jgi:aspartate 1-decarboxylase